MRLTRGMNVVCHDGNEYTIGDRTSENYVIGFKPYSTTQRLFKPDGNYAGSDKAKSVSRVL